MPGHSLTGEVGTTVLKAQRRRGGGRIEGPRPPMAGSEEDQMRGAAPKGRFVFPRMYFHTGLLSST